MSKQSKIICVIAALPSSLLNFRYHLLKEMVDRGHRVIACAAREDSLSNFANEDIALRLKEIGVTYHGIPLRRTGINPIDDFATTRSIYGLCRRISPDILFCYTAKPIIYGSLAGSLAGVSSIHSLVTGLGFGVNADSTHAGPAALIVKKLYQAALAKNKTVSFQNPDDRALMQDLGIIRQRTQTVIVNGSGVDIAHYTPTVIPRDPVTFLLIARLLREKGIVEYSRAAAIVKSHYPSTRFILVGPMDPHPDAIEEQEVREWESAGTLTWAGAVSDVRPHIAASSVYVLPSYHEGTPRTVLEAMAMGRPIITTDAPGCRETVREGENGFLVPVRSVDALVSAMEQFITCPDLLDSMGKCSREIAEAKYDVHKVNAVMLETMGLL